jgi:hypothetical protein
MNISWRKSGRNGRRGERWFAGSEMRWLAVRDANNEERGTVFSAFKISSDNIIA